MPGRHPRGTGGAVGVTCEDIAANGCLRVRFRPDWIFSGTFQRPFLAGKRPGGSQHTREPPWNPVPTKKDDSYGERASTERGHPTNPERTPGTAHSIGAP